MNVAAKLKKNSNYLLSTLFGTLPSAMVDELGTTLCASAGFMLMILNKVLELCK